MEGLVTGDFNASFAPGNAKASGTLGMSYGETRRVEAGQEFELPIRTTGSMEVGAISMILDIPSDLVEVKDVVLKGSDVPVMFRVNGNELRIGWHNLTPALNVQEASELLVLKLKATANFTEGKIFQLAFVSSPLNELADGMAVVIDDVTLNTDIIANSPLGVNNLQNQALSLNVYPNPFNDFTTISYKLPVDGKVTLEVRDMLGHIVATPVNEYQASGKHTLKFASEKLPQGVYNAVIKLQPDGDTMVDSFKLVIYR
jgi:hypothetical protein